MGVFDLSDTPRDLSVVEVEFEIGTEEGRVPDLLLYLPDRWYLLLELKVDSPEGDAQTADYAAADELGPVVVSNYPEERRYYGYLAPEIPATIDETFTGIRWEDITTQFIDVRNDLTPSDYPLRSIVQLDDFIDTLHTTMPETDADTRERARLFFKYQDEIKAAEQSARTFVKEILQYKWTDVFTQPETTPDFWDDSWFILKQGTTYGQFARDSWKLPNGLDIHFEHHPRLGRFKKGDLEFRLDIEAPKTVRNQDPDPRLSFRRKFVELVENGGVDLPEFSNVDDGQGKTSVNHQLVTTFYSYEPGNEEEYYETLAQAAQDHAGLVEVVDALIGAYPNLEAADLEALR